MLQNDSERCMWQLAVSILEGMTIAEVAASSGLSDSQVRQGVWQALSDSQPEIFAEGAREGTPSLSYLRHHKSAFLERGPVVPMSKRESLEVANAIQTLRRYGFKAEAHSPRARAMIERAKVRSNSSAVQRSF